MMGERMNNIFSQITTEFDNFIKSIDDEFDNIPINDFSLIDPRLINDFDLEAGQLTTAAPTAPIAVVSQKSEAIPCNVCGRKFLPARLVSYN